MTTLYQKARDAEEQGAYTKAAEYWARVGFKDLVEEHFEHTRNTRIGVTVMLRAISCDTRAGNSGRARALFNIIRPVLGTIKETANDEFEYRPEIVAGLASEWLGDGYLMLGEETALDHYQDARDLYEGSVRPIENWGGEEEFDYAYWAFESFLEFEGYSLPERSEDHFVERIERKLEIAGELLVLDDHNYGR